MRLMMPQRQPRSQALTMLVAGCMAISACASTTEQSSTGVLNGEPASTEEASLQYGDTIKGWPEEATAGAAQESQVVNDYPAGYELITWDDLLAPGFSNDEIFDRYADRLLELEDGSPEAAAIYAEMQAEADSADFVNEELDGTKVNLAGFVAPLTYEDDIVTEFLLVPYFGACIHVPAPPGNQTVLVSVDKADGLTMDQSWGAVWVAGTLTANSATTDLATASYTMTNATSGVYDENS